jgi:FAD binding domain
MKGVQILDDPEVREEGFDEVRFNDDPSLSNIVQWNTRRRYAVSVGAGVSTQELTNALEASNMFSVAAGHGNISVAGGWLQGGGHGPFSYNRLGVDEVLEFQVVTADSGLKIANSVINSDLFWALKGGGGGTFGVVVQATVNAWPDTSRAAFSAWLNITTAAPEDEIYEIATRCFDELQSLSSLQGFCFIYPRAIRILAWTHPTGRSDDKIAVRGHRRDWVRSVKALQAEKHVASVIHEEIPYGSFKELYDGTFGMLNARLYGKDDKCRQKSEWFPNDYECRYGAFTTPDSSLNPRRPPPRDILDPVSIFTISNTLLTV